MLFVRRHQKLTLCQTGLLLAKAEPICDGITSEITYLRRSKNLLHSSWERGVRIYGNYNHADTKASEEGGVGGARGPRTVSTVMM